MEAPTEPGPDANEIAAVEVQDEFSGQVPTRKALEKELQEAQEQVEKLKSILELDNSIIELFLGTERYL